MNPVFQRLALGIQRVFNNYDSASFQYNAKEWTSHFPIIIVGSPRTGSTLLYQSLLSQFELSYISNIMALFPAIMVKMAKLYPQVAMGYADEIRENEYGYVPGLTSPNEIGKILRKWMVDAETEFGTQRVRQAIMAISDITNRPMIMKNQRRFTNNIPWVQRVLPEARFIFITRDPRYTAQSLLVARQKFLGSYEAWWNVQPEGYETVLDKHYTYQVLWQVRQLEDVVYRELLTQPDAPVITIKYEQFCQAPDVILDELQETFRLQKHPDAPDLKDSLRLSQKVRLSEADWTLMNEHYQEIFADRLYQE